LRHTSPLIEFKNVALGYSSKVIVDHLNIKIYQGDLLAVIGPNGGGKSTFLKSIVGLIKPIHGCITLPSSQHNSLAYMSQHIEVDRHFPLSVLDLVSMGLWQAKGPYRELLQEDFKKIEEALQKVHLWHLRAKTIGELSGGQWQRALFARAIVQDADIILLDEPFNAVDVKTQSQLIHLIKTLNQQGKTIAVVLHHTELIKEHFERVLFLAGKQHFLGTTDEALQNYHHYLDSQEYLL
jgi:zinc/manganese transport system ATP-binding protein